MLIMLINGPNLNLLGQREPEVYGSQTLKDVEQALAKRAEKDSVSFEAFQSNSESEIIDKIHQYIGRDDVFLIFNPGAFTHTSIAIRDAILGVSMPFVEVHISNVYQRESFRHKSFFSDIAKGCIIGLGVHGYDFAMEYALNFIQKKC